MSKKVLLISEQQVKSQSIIESNVDTKILSKTIQNVQEVHLKGVLGATLYDALLDAVSEQVTGSTQMSAAHATLLNDYVQPYMIHAVVAEFMVVNHFKVTNKGLLKMNDNAAGTASTEELEYIKSIWDNHADSYKAKLVKYLNDENLIASEDYKNTDTDTTSGSIGWYL